MTKSKLKIGQIPVKITDFRANYDVFTSQRTIVLVLLPNQLLPSQYESLAAREMIAAGEELAQE